MIGCADWGRRRCRVGKLSITCVRLSGVVHLALTAAAVAGNGITKGRWECCDVFAMPSSDLAVMLVPKLFLLAQVLFLYFFPFPIEFLFLACSSLVKSWNKWGVRMMGMNGSILKIEVREVQRRWSVVLQCDECWRKTVHFPVTPSFCC